MLNLSAKLRSLSQAGDTIVEVMIAVAILGSAFALSYATAHKSLLSTRNSQEHSEALQIINSQLELIRANVNAQQESSPVFSFSSMHSNHPFCMDPSSDQPIDATILPPSTPNCAMGTEQIGTPPHGLYAITITYDPHPMNGVNQDIFTFNISWPGIGSLGTQTEQLNYKIHANDTL